MTDTWPCPNPKFEWIPESGWWSACLACGRLAWDHEQSDPLADIRNHFAQASSGLDGSHYPPGMRSAETETP